MKIDQYFENNRIYIGENAQDNSQILHKSKQTDIWFHLAKFPSSHVIIECDKHNRLTKQMIYYCAQLVKSNTKYRNMHKLSVNYTCVANIATSDEPGKVIVKGAMKTVLV